MTAMTSLGVAMMIASAAVAAPLEFYLAPGGADTNPGTKARPFATLAHARDAVRKAKAGAHRPVNVVLRGGTYYMEQALVLGPEDSGTADCPVTYMAYPGEKPVLSGGRRITGWKRGPGDLWVADIPDVKRGKWYFRQLHVKGQRRVRARLPREGQYNIAGGADPAQRAFQYKPGEIDPKWRNLSDVEVVLKQYWGAARLRIEAVDEAAHVVRFTGDCWRPTSWSNGWYAENVYEGLAKPGDWYLDRKEGVLYYWPMPGEARATVDAVAPVARCWLGLVGDWKAGKLVEHLIFRGLTFEHSAWSLDDKLGFSYPQASIESAPERPPWLSPLAHATQLEPEVPAGIWCTGARHIRFEDNEIAHTGAWGLRLAQGGCKHNEVVGNRFHDIGAGAIRVGGPNNTFEDAEETGRTAITDNRFDECSKVYLGSPAIYIGQSSGNLVAHNEITGECEWAVSVGWTWSYMPPGNARDNIVEYNHCHDLGRGPLGMHGVLYFLGVQPGTVCRHNLIHDVAGSGSGIVLDNGSSGMLIENNIVHHVDYDALLFNFNDLGNIVGNNVFALARNSLMNRAGDAGKIDQTGIFYRNLFYYNSGQGKLFVPDAWPNFEIVMDYNLYYDESGKPPQFLAFTFDQWKQHGLDGSSIVADPLFVDAARGDFSLKPGSPALKLGFKPIDVSGVGPGIRKSK
jgi:hypothetical protein